MAIPTYNPPRSIHGDPDTIEALIMAARMEGLWSVLDKPNTVCVIPSMDRVTLYRFTGCTPEEIMAWNDLLKLSRNFEVRYV